MKSPWITRPRLLQSLVNWRARSTVAPFLMFFRICGSPDSYPTVSRRQPASRTARDQYVVSTSEFDEVKARLAALENERKLNEGKETSAPTLRRRSRSSTDKTSGDAKSGDDRPTLENTATIRRTAGFCHRGRAVQVCPTANGGAWLPGEGYGGDHLRLSSFALSFVLHILAAGPDRAPTDLTAGDPQRDYSVKAGYDRYSISILVGFREGFLRLIESTWDLSSAFRQPFPRPSGLHLPSRLSLRC
jgi:hypothetical protein